MFFFSAVILIFCVLRDVRVRHEFEIFAHTIIHVVPLFGTETSPCVFSSVARCFQNSDPSQGIMLSLGDEQWDDYYGQAPDSPVRNTYDGDDSESSDVSSDSCEPRSPPHSPSSSLGKIPELQLSLSPRSVEEEDLDAQVSSSSSSWMCIYDLDSLCMPGDTFSQMDPSQMFRDNGGGLIPYVVDLFSSDTQSEKKDDFEPHRDDLPIHNFLIPLNEPEEEQSTHRIRRRYRSRKSRTKLDDFPYNRCVLVESCCEAIPEVEETEEIEAIYMRVRYPAPPTCYSRVPSSHIFLTLLLFFAATTAAAANHSGR